VVNERPLHTYRGFAVPLPSGVPPEHLPSRPSWACGVCGQEWPCPTARATLRDEGNPTQLATLMWVYLENYCMDAGPGSLDGVFERFVGWTRK
jgi:hypothetical protein